MNTLESKIILVFLGRTLANLAELPNALKLGGHVAYRDVTRHTVHIAKLLQQRQTKCQLTKYQNHFFSARTRPLFYLSQVAQHLILNSALASSQALDSRIVLNLRQSLFELVGQNDLKNGRILFS